MSLACDKHEKVALVNIFPFFLQTHAVLRQASIESLKLIVVLNKIDRLIIGLKMQPHEAYMHLNQILEQLNAIVAQQYASLLFERSNNVKSSL